MNPRYFFWIVFLISTYFILRLYEPFILNIIIAVLLCVSTFEIKKCMDRFTKYNALSSFLSLSVFLAFFICPLVLIGLNLTNELLNLQSNQIIEFFNISKQHLIDLVRSFPIAIQSKITQTLNNINIANVLFSISAMVGKLGANFILNLAVITIFLYLFYFYGLSIKEYIINIIPFDKNHSNEILEEVSGVLKVVGFTIVISMILQGFSFGIVAKIFGFSGILLGVIYALASIIPIVGGSVVWIPISLYLYSKGNTNGAIFLALYSMIFIGFVIDNLIKPLIINMLNKKILSAPVQINEILIFISIIAGLSSFGFWGMIIGPAINSFFLSLLRIYKTKLKDFN